MVAGVPSFNPVYAPNSIYARPVANVETCNAPRDLQNMALNLAQLKVEILKQKMSGKLTDQQIHDIRSGLEAVTREVDLIAQET